MRTTITLPDDLAQEVKREAQRRRVSIATVAREALREHLQATTYLAATRLGAQVEAAFIAALAELDVEAPPPQEWKRIAELIGKYADFPLGAVDASVVALAERLKISHVATIDHRRFRAVKPRHCDALRLLPE